MIDVFEPINAILPYLLLILVFGLATKLIEAYLKSEKNNELPYVKKDSIMTNSEQKYFRELEQEYGHMYYVFPQINLDKVFNVTTRNKYQTYLNKISRKSVDYILVDKQTLQTVQLIELNDPTHKRPDRIARDNFVKRICEKTGTPLKTV